MRRRASHALVVLAIAACFLPEQEGPARESNSAVDANAVAALQKMGNYLRTLKTFQVEAATTDEDVLEDGQKVQYSGSASILARVPDRMRAEVQNEKRRRLFLYDGSQFTLFAERVGYYATVPAPPTISKLADKLETDYGFSVPLRDLFRWGTQGWDAAQIQSAADTGPSEVGGVTCEQYILRQKDVDWQIWLQRGDYPLPRKLVITTRTDEARPQHTEILTWNLAPSFNDAAFKFDPPAGAQRVALLRDSDAADGSTGRRAQGPVSTTR
jgi:hypothetical protein